MPVGTATALVIWSGELATAPASPVTDEGYYDTTLVTLRIYDGAVWNNVSPPTWSQVSLAPNHVIATQTNGTLWGWGDDYNGRVGNGSGSSSDVYVPVLIDAGSWDSVGAGEYHSLAVRSDGTLHVWGYDYHSDGRLGLNPEGQTVHAPTQVGTDTDWQALDAGNRFTIAIKSDGSVWSWGWNGGGALGDGKGFTTDQFTPKQAGADNNWVEIDAGGYYFTVALNSLGELFSWGESSYGQLAQGLPLTDLRSPTQIGSATDWVSFATGHNFGAAVNALGEMYTWGYNYYGQLGLSDSTERNTQVQVTFPVGVTWTQVSAGDYHTLALDSLGRIYSTGYNTDGQLGDGTTTNRSIFLQIGTATDWVLVRAGAYNSFAIKSDGTLWAWGKGNSGQLADASTNPAAPTSWPIDNSVPTQIGFDTDWIDVTAGYYDAASVKADGSLWVWGNNGNGIGLGPNVTSTGSGSSNSYAPFLVRRVGLDLDWESVSSSPSGYFSLTVKNGQLFSWGYGSDGELGIGDGNLSSYFYVPQLVGSDRNWQKVSAGEDHSVALKDDGTIWEWGYGRALALPMLGTDEPYQPFPIEIIK